jgi:DNA-directed RNA polymerase specialized sigma24 family protein
MTDGPAPLSALPELANVTKEEFRDLYEATWAFARRIARSNDLADELTQTAFALLLTTRRWNPHGEVPLAKHLMGTVKSTLSNRRTSKKPEREAEAAEEVTRDVGETTASPERMHLDRNEAAREEAKATRTLDTLRARLAGKPIALARLDLVARGIDKPSEQAHVLKVSVEEIYRAREATQYHLSRIYAAESDDDEGEAT